MPLNPYIESFVGKTYFYHYRFFGRSRRKIMTYKKCIKSFFIYRVTGFARGKINLGTLDILELNGRLKAEEEALNRRIIDKKISTINQRNEFRSFFFFLKKEYPEDYQHLPFLKSERPDFILRYKREVIGIEITEAIDAGDARQRAKIYESELRGRRAGEIEEYVNQSPGMAVLGKSKISLEKLITKRIKDKKEKFEDFQRVDREILIIIANHDEFQKPGDVEKIRKALGINGSLEKDSFSLVVMNLIHGIYAHFRWKKGRVVLEKSNGNGVKVPGSHRGKGEKKKRNKYPEFPAV